MAEKRNIFLVGPMGAGKSTIGRHLADELHLDFFDSDQEIERRTGADIAWIFDLEGEDGFRKREENVINDLTDKQGIVLATGGGSIVTKAVRNRLSARGIVVYLQTTIDKQVARTQRDKRRPLLQNEDPEQVLRDLAEMRNPLYEEVADYIVAEHGRADIIMANNVYAHIPDIQGTTHAIKQTLKDDGVFVFEVHYLGKVITGMQYDMIYHEHLYYYSLLSAIKHFERYDMMVFDVKEVPIHGGSMRFYVCKKGSKYSSSVSEAVILLEENEKSKCFDQYKTFQNFYFNVNIHRVELITLLNKLRRQGHTIAGYGASGRANTMIQYCGINHDHLDYIIDDSPAKVGLYTPGSHFEICTNSILNKSELPDYLLIFAWSFFNEIRKKNSDYLNNGGHIILPLPEISLFPQPQQ